MRLSGEGLNRVEKGGIQRAELALGGAEFFELGARGEFAIPEEIRDFFEGALIGQVLSAIAAIDQRAGFAGDLRDGSVVDDDAVKTFCDDAHDWALAITEKSFLPR